MTGVSYLSRVTDPAGLRVLRRPPTADGPGAGRLLILVHGSMDRSTSFTRLMSKLPDWSVVAYDRRGYAGSADAGPPESFQRQVEDLVEVLDGVPAVAFGHSFGGDVVLAAASRHPEMIPAALVWEAPQPWLPWWPSHTAAGGAQAHLEPDDRAEWFMRRQIGDGVWERLPSATRARRRAEGPTLQAEMASLSGGPVFDAALVPIPVIVGRGTRSSAHQRRSAQELAAALPQGELAEIEGASHGAHLSHPGELADLVRRAASRA
jgi:pimeloyl-ACP methyl ester carboxylesterase